MSKKVISLQYPKILITQSNIKKNTINYLKKGKKG